MTKDKPQPLSITYEPTFRILESRSNGIADKKIGQRVRGILDYKVIEKTKNYVVLRVGFLTLTESRRVY